MGENESSIGGNVDPKLLSVEGKSYFARRLASDPELAARCDAVVKQLRNAVNRELEAVERSEQLTAEDFALIINARAPQFELPQFE